MRKQLQKSEKLIQLKANQAKQNWCTPNKHCHGIRDHFCWITEKQGDLGFTRTQHYCYSFALIEKLQSQAKYVIIDGYQFNAKINKSYHF